MEFGRYLVLSTAHVRCATAELLTAWSALPPILQPIEVSPTAFGWFLSTRIIGEEDALPEDLRALLGFGRSHGCDYVLLDSDGEEVEPLPVFPW